MRHLMLHGDFELRWTDTDDPRLAGPHAALVRPVAAATCDFDHLVVSGAAPAKRPLPIGHECVAEVVAVGEQVTAVAVGDVVVVPFQISCGVCDACRRGATNACSAVAWLSCYGLGAMAGDWGGVVADLVSVPYADAMLVPLPPNVSPAAAAAIGCNIVDAYRCVAPQLDAIPGGNVLVLSQAFPNIALYATQIAVACGAVGVTFHDPDPAMASKAKALGATPVESLADINRRSHDVVVDASMHPKALTTGLSAVARGGFVTISTMYAGRPIAMPMMELFETAATVQSGQPHARALVEPVLDLVASGAIDPIDVIDSIDDWESAPSAFRRGKGKHVVVR